MEYNGERTSSDITSSDFIDTESFIAIKNKRNILDISVRPDNMTSIISWETSMFQELCSSKNFINVQNLLDAYLEIMEYFNLQAMDNGFVENTLRDIYFDGYYLISNNNNENVIFEYNFYKSLKYYANDLKWRACNYRVVQSGNKINNYTIWHKYRTLILTSIIDLMIASIVIIYTINFDNFVSWITMIYIASSLCVTNLIYYLCRYIDIKSYWLGHSLIRLFSLEYCNVAKFMYVFKFCVFYILYIIAHLLQINHALKICKHGCKRSSIKIVKSTDAITVISWSFFLTKPLYWLTLIILTLFIALRIILHKRMNSFYVIVLLYICVIVQQFLDINNIKLQFVLLFVLCLFVIDHRHDVNYYTFDINQYLEFKKYIKIIINPRNSITKELTEFNCALINTNHASIGTYKWINCMFVNDLCHNNKYIIVDRKYLTFDNLAKNKPISIGYCTKSKFRLYYIYRTICIFCKNAGIYEFIALASHKKANQVINKITVIWAITDIELVIDLRESINHIKNNFLDITMHIYYAPDVLGNIYLQNKIFARFNYLQCVIHKLTSIDILSQVSCPAYCLINKLNAYDILNSLLLTTSLIGNTHPIGVFICGDSAFINNIKINTQLLYNNQYGINIEIWSECI